MTEIKSTIDLVLEKTRNLTLSEEEKTRLAQKEMEKKVKGLCNRFLENLIDLNRFKEELEKLKQDGGTNVYSLLKKYLIHTLNMDEEEPHVLSALSEIAGMDTSIIENIQDDYRLEKGKAKEIYRNKAFEALRKRGVSGPSVTPNLDKTHGWNQFINDLRKKYQEKLRAIEGDDHASDSILQK